MPAPAPVVNGWQNQPLPLRMVVPLGTPKAAGLIFPGAAYAHERPLLSTARDVFAATAAEVMLTERYYGMDPALSALTGEEREACIATDAGAYATALFQRAAGLPLLLAGKSLGTSSLAHAMKQVPDLAAGVSVWLTPLWKDPMVLDAIAACGSRAYVLIGTADPQWDPALVDELNKRAKKLAKSLPVLCVVEGADHGMSVAGNALATAKVLTDLKPALVAHVAQAFGPPPL